MAKGRKITRLYAEIRKASDNGSVETMRYDMEDLAMAIRVYAGACKKVNTVLSDCFGTEPITESLLREMVRDDFLYMAEWNMNEMCVSHDFINIPNQAHFYIGKYSYYLYQ